MKFSIIVVIKLSDMKKINIENLKPDNELMAYDPILLKWSKCKVIFIETRLINLEFIEGSLKGLTWYEDLKLLKDTNYYRPVIQN